MRLVHKKGDIFPLRAMPEETLNRKILELSEWLCSLLSIKADDSNVSRLEVLLPMIKECCWSMTIADIQKAFLKYSKGELSMEPRDNYLTAILFSKVITDYKQQMPKKTELLEKTEITKQEKITNAQKSAKLALEDFIATNKVEPTYSVLFDRLYDSGILPNTDSGPKVEKRYETLLKCAYGHTVAPLLDKMKWMEREKLDDTKEYKELGKAKEHLKDLKSKEIQSKFRCLVLEGYFRNLIKKEESPKEYFSMLVESDKFIDAI